MSLKELLEAATTLGTLGFALVALYAFFAGWVHSDKELRERLAGKDATIDYERRQKEEAVEMTKAALASHDRLADAVETRNELDRERIRTNNR